MLKIENLTKTFNNKKILDNISLNIDKGQIALILGESGVGKSTLIRILNNLETPDSGEVFLNDIKLDLKKINKNHEISMVFQQFNLFDHLTSEQNITLALEKVLKKRPEQAKFIAHNLLKKYGLEDKAKVYPSQLSGGQKQRLAIARTMALKPKVICLDEPTSALDPMLTNFVAQNIQELANDGFIVIVVTHNVVLIDKLNCIIYLLKEGKIVENSKSTDFLANKSKYLQIKSFVEGLPSNS